MSDNQNNPIVQAFVYETESMLEQIEQILLNCEDTKEIAEDDVNEIFRIMHTIKGGAAVVEFEKLAELAHSMEDMFFYIREEKPVINDISLITDVMFEIPSNKQISKCIITKDTVLGDGKPEVIIDETRKVEDTKKISKVKPKPRAKKETA